MDHDPYHSTVLWELCLHIGGNLKFHAVQKKVLFECPSFLAVLCLNNLQTSVQYQCFITFILLCNDWKPSFSSICKTCIWSLPFLLPEGFPVGFPAASVVGRGNATWLARQSTASIQRLVTASTPHMSDFCHSSLFESSDTAFHLRGSQLSHDEEVQLRCGAKTRESARLMLRLMKLPLIGQMSVKISATKTWSPRASASSGHWEQWSGILVRGQPTSLVLTRLSPSLSVKRAPGRPWGDSQSRLGPIAQKYLLNRKIVLHTDSVKNYKAKVKGVVCCRPLQEEETRGGKVTWSSPQYVRVVTHPLPDGKILKVKAGTQHVDCASRFPKDQLRRIKG